MKIPDHEKTPIITKKPPQAVRPQNQPRPDSDSVEVRCKREGVKLNPATIRSRMQRHNLSFEEAVAYVPKTRKECGMIAKKHTRWGKNVPANSEEYQARQGRTSRFGESPKE